MNPGHVEGFALEVGKPIGDIDSVAHPMGGELVGAINGAPNVGDGADEYRQQCRQMNIKPHAGEGKHQGYERRQAKKRCQQGTIDGDGGNEELAFGELAEQLFLEVFGGAALQVADFNAGVMAPGSFDPHGGQPEKSRMERLDNINGLGSVQSGTADFASNKTPTKDDIDVGDGVAGGPPPQEGGSCGYHHARTNDPRGLESFGAVVRQEAVDEIKGVVAKGGDGKNDGGDDKAPGAKHRGEGMDAMIHRLIGRSCFLLLAERCEPGAHRRGRHRVRGF